MTKIVSIETRLNQKIQEAEIPNNYLDNLPITRDFSTGHSHYLKIQVERMPKVPGSNPHSGLQNYLTMLGSHHAMPTPLLNPSPNIPSIN